MRITVPRTLPTDDVLMVRKGKGKTRDPDGGKGAGPAQGVAHAWAGHPPYAPCFIVTHNPPQEWVKEGSPFTFVTEGVESAIAQAKAVAGDKNVAVSTASTMQRALKAGLLDEIHVFVAPVLLGEGIRLFDHLGSEPIDLECIRVLEAPGVTHLGYRVVK